MWRTALVIVRAGFPRPETQVRWTVLRITAADAGDSEAEIPPQRYAWAMCYDVR